MGRAIPCMKREYGTSIVWLKLKKRKIIHFPPYAFFFFCLALHSCERMKMHLAFGLSSHTSVTDILECGFYYWDESISANNFTITVMIFYLGKLLVPDHWKRFFRHCDSSRIPQCVMQKISHEQRSFLFSLN